MGNVGHTSNPVIVKEACPIKFQFFALDVSETLLASM